MVRSFQAERIRSGQRSTGKKAQKEENHPGTMRCSEGLDCFEERMPRNRTGVGLSQV